MKNEESAIFEINFPDQKETNQTKISKVWTRNWLIRIFIWIVENFTYNQAYSF